MRLYPEAIQPPDHGKIPPGWRQLYAFCPSLTHLKSEWTALIYSWKPELSLHQGKGTKYLVFGATEQVQENKKCHTGVQLFHHALSIWLNYLVMETKATEVRLAPALGSCAMQSESFLMGVSRVLLHPQ